VFWLNLDEARARLEEAVLVLARENPEIEQIWLFGSLARGDAVPGSDADILVVLSDSRLPFLDRSAHYQPESCGIGVDVLAYTRSEFERMRAGGNHFLERAIAEGIRIYNRLSDGG
jgi:predicted nucleotidyltransferase